MKTKSILFLCLILAIKGSSQCKIDYSNYHLVLNEDFNTSLADLSTRWYFDTGDPEWIGAGIEYYDPNQISLLPGGILRLKATKVPTTNMITPSGKVKEVKYKSGILRSKMIVDAGGWQENGFKYGIFEMRAKIPNGRVTPGTGEWDTWPAFWLTSGPTEIDIMDDIQPDPSRVWQMGVIDWTKFPHDNPTDWDLICDCNIDPNNSLCSAPEYSSDQAYPAQSIVKVGFVNKVYRSNKSVPKCSIGIFAKKRHTDLSSTYNVYTGVWTPNKVTFFLNGVEVCTISNSNIATHPFPARIIANLEMMAGGADAEYNMDIDYIKVWKPNNDNYTLPYKSASAFMNHDVSQSTSYPILPYEAPNAVALNTNNSKEVFYRHRGDGICVAKQATFSSFWNVSTIPLNDGATSRVAGDVRYLPVHDMVIYAGTDNRINYFGRSTTQPSGFYHWYITSNYNCYWCVTDDLISTAPGSLQTSSNGEIFYRGIDNKMHWYRNVNGNWVHQILPSNYTSAEMVAGDIVVQSPGNTVYYRGYDGRMQCFYKDGSNYIHVWIDDNWSTSSYLVSSKPGSMAVAPSLNGVLYIGTDNKIHLFYWDVTWKHLLLPYTYGNPGLGYPNADYALNGVTWDNANQRLYYNGYDGRIQAFGKTGSQWWHNWVDDYWNTDEFWSFNSESQFGGAKYASTIYGPMGIFYIRKDNHLAYFKYEACEILNPPSGYSPNAAKPGRNDEENDDASNDVTDLSSAASIGSHHGYLAALANNKKRRSVFSEKDVIVIPNPSNDGIFVLNIPQDFTGFQPVELEIVDMLGRLMLKKSFLGNSLKVDLSDKPSGVYFAKVHQGGVVVQKKLVKK